MLNATGPRAREYGNGKPVAELTVDEFMTPVDSILRSHFITAKAAACRMVNQHSGVIILLTGSPARPHGPGTSSIGAAFSATENFTRSLAIELGPHAVRVVCLRTAANPDSRTIQDTLDAMTEKSGATRDQVAAGIGAGRLLPQSPRTADTARAVAFLASDRSRMMTGIVLNSSAGVVPD